VLYPIVLLDYSLVVTSAGRFLAGATASSVQALAAKAEVGLPSFSRLMLFPYSRWSYQLALQSINSF